jgi:hypothetical protein
MVISQVSHDNRPIATDWSKFRQFQGFGYLG